MKSIHLKHETHQHVILKFALVLLIFLGYFGFISFQYGLRDGFLISFLTWSFFVLCTPIADAGFLIDFPLRVVLKVKMIVSELFVWIFAIGINLYAFFIHPEMYGKTKLLSLFKHILEQPLPFWIIIFLSATGTFLSVKFGDELLDVLKHKDRNYHKKHNLKWKLFGMTAVFVFTIILYDFLLKKLGVEIPL